MAEIHKGFLGELFTGVVAKRLTLVETVTKKSNQHEFQGIKSLRFLFGEEDRKQIPATFIWLSEEQSAVSEEGFISWSNVRKGKPRAPEYHLYYSGNTVTESMSVNDTVFVALRPNNTALVISVPAESSVLQQLYWLFGISEQEQFEISFGDEQNAAAFRDSAQLNSAELDFVARYILDELGIDFELPETEMLDKLLEKYPRDLPKTSEFSQFARETLPVNCSPVEEPDLTILAWLDHEEKLFRRHEHLRIARHLNDAIKAKDGADVEGFLSFSKSISQARMSRMGHSLEHHLGAIFTKNKLRFSKGKITERKSKPDFLFPSIEDYKNEAFPVVKLTMLASKSSLKDRWRQMTKEADRIPQKHLFTLQPSISLAQTEEIRHQEVQLVLPRPIHDTFKLEQKPFLLDLRGFINLIKLRDSLNSLPTPNVHFPDRLKTHSWVGGFVEYGDI